MDDAGIFLGILGEALKADVKMKDQTSEKSWNTLSLLQMSCLLRATMVSVT